MTESSTRLPRILLFGNAATTAGLLLAPLALLVLAVGAAAVWGPPFGMFVYLLIHIAALSTLPGLAFVYLAIRNRRRRARARQRT
jgi:hypothetical protein